MAAPSDRAAVTLMRRAAMHRGMEHPCYTLATWHVRPGEEEAFEEAWRDMGTAFDAVPGSPPLTGTLLRHVDHPHVFVSFGGWPSLDHIARMRQDPGAKAAMDRVLVHCTTAEPGAYERVATVETPGQAAP